LQRERRFPSSVAGPVLFRALRRFAAICLRELIENQAEHLGSFVRPAKAGVFSRDQTCRGKSQAPRSLDGRVEGNQDSEAHRQGLLMGDHESPGRNESVNAKWPRNHMNPRAEPTNEGRRQHGVPKSDRCGISISAGWKRQHGDKDMPSNWRSLPRPGEKSPEQGRSYNRRNREIDRWREGGGWVRSSDEAEQCPRSEGALLFVTSPAIREARTR